MYFSIPSPVVKNILYIMGCSFCIIIYSRIFPFIGCCIVFLILSINIYLILVILVVRDVMIDICMCCNKFRQVTSQPTRKCGVCEGDVRI